MAVELAAVLILATAVSDAFGFASISFYLLVLGVPITAAAGLVCFGRVVDAVNGGRMDALGRLQATLSALLVAGIVIGAAVREPFIAAGTVPPEASGVLALCFALLVLQALIALVPSRPGREERRPARPHSSLSR
jgi:hypothetical protein